MVRDNYIYIYLNCHEEAVLLSEETISLSEHMILMSKAGSPIAPEDTTNMHS